MTTGSPWWWHPASITLFNLGIYLILRAWWGGGSKYLPSKAWYALCFIIPVFVAVGIASGNLCIPLRLDWPTMFHVAAALLYMQLDLLVALWFCGKQYFGSANAPGMFVSKLLLTPALGDAGVPPLLRSIFEFNGALMHEIFWNICICQNMINNGFSPLVAIAAVPVVSCSVHAVTCNATIGLRCAPQFCWVALSYHASGSVLPAGFIHAMWYITDGKLLISLQMLRRDWDFEERREEQTTPPPDKLFYLGWLFIMVYYGLLNWLSLIFPALRSHDPHISDCRFGQWPTNGVERVIFVAICFQVIGGVVTWNVVRAAMDILEDTGDATTNGLVRAEQAAMKYLGKNSAWEEHADMPSYSGTQNPSALDEVSDSESPSKVGKSGVHCCSTNRRGVC